jgi:hypothetical protein
VCALCARVSASAEGLTGDLTGKSKRLAECCFRKWVLACRQPSEILCCFWWMLIATSSSRSTRYQQPAGGLKPWHRERTSEGGATLVGQTQLIDKLRELGRNLWWTWQPNVIALFRELDPALWRKVDHNPVEFLKRLPVEQLERRAAEMALDSRIDYAFRRLAEYLQDTDSWGSIHATILRARPVAYFSAEFGLHESLPIYSGGLGVLAGDHLKSASDLGIPLIAIGLLYAQG